MARLLRAGVDSLYISARGVVKETFDPLRNARARADAAGGPVHWGVSRLTVPQAHGMHVPSEP